MMTGFKRRISGVGSDCSDNLATFTAQLFENHFCDIFLHHELNGIDGPILKNSLDGLNSYLKVKQKDGH